MVVAGLAAFGVEGGRGRDLGTVCLVAGGTGFGGERVPWLADGERR